jgi:hypothetical protein
MSQLETESQRFLQPLLTGARFELDTAAQGILARWGLKTAMVLEALDRSQELSYTSAERGRLRIGGRRLKIDCAGPQRGAAEPGTIGLT